MISLLGTTITASAPWLLLGIPCALAWLVYIYRIRGTSHHTVVSSLLFLQELPRRPIGRRTFVPPLSFWLELAIFTLLILATAGLLVGTTGKHVAIVLDSSLSMGSMYGSGGTRLEQVKKMALLTLQQEPSSTTFSIYASTSELTLLSPRGDNRSQARAAVASTTQSYRPDLLHEHITTLLNDPSHDAVWVYTDRELATATRTPRLVVTTLPLDPATQINAWIHSVREETKDSTRLISAEIGYVGPSARDARIDGECFDGNDTLSGNLPAVIKKLLPNERSTVLLTPSSPNWSYCRLQVRLQDAALFDALSLDNEGWISQTTSKPTVTVHSALSPEALGLPLISTITFEKASGDTASNNLPTIYHRTAPAKLPTAPTLLVLPPTGPLPWQGGEALAPSLQGGEITRWDDSHPLMAYVKPALLSLSGVQPLRCPDSSAAILFSPLGPIACAGEANGARYVILGFETFPFNAGANPTVSILTLNVSKWLFHSLSLVPGTTIPRAIKVADSTQSAAYVKPHTVPIEISHTKTIAPTTPGIITLKATDGSSRSLAINSFEDSESDLSVRTTLALQASTAPLSAHRATLAPNSITAWLAALALLVLVADIIRRIARRIRWGEA